MRIVPNAIEVDKYKFNNDNRKDIRKRLGIPDDAYVIGHVGRFDYQKNQSFLVDVFKKIQKSNPKAHLIMVGDGVDKNSIIDKIKYENIFNVHIEPACAEVEKFYSAFDVFVLPSHFEGLGIVLIEAQANGLECVASDTVPRDANVVGNV